MSLQCTPSWPSSHWRLARRMSAVNISPECNLACTQKRDSRSTVLLNIRCDHVTLPSPNIAYQDGVQIKADPETKRLFKNRQCARAKSNFAKLLCFHVRCYRRAPGQIPCTNCAQCTFLVSSAPLGRRTSAACQAIPRLWSISLARRLPTVPISLECRIVMILPR